MQICIHFYIPLLHPSLGGVFAFNSSILLLTNHSQTVFPQAYENMWQKQVRIFVPFSNVNRYKRTGRSSAEALLASSSEAAYRLN